jgi:hypothetical protein
LGRFLCYLSTRLFDTDFAMSSIMNGERITRMCYDISKMCEPKHEDVMQALDVTVNHFNDAFGTRFLSCNFLAWVVGLLEPQNRPKKQTALGALAMRKRILAVVIEVAKHPLLVHLVMRECAVELLLIADIGDDEQGRSSLMALHAISLHKKGLELLASAGCVRVLFNHIGDPYLQLNWSYVGMVCTVLHRVCSVNGLEGASDDAVSGSVEIICAHISDECVLFGENARICLMVLRDIVIHRRAILNERQLSCIEDRANDVLDMFKEGGVHRDRFLDSDDVVGACQEVVRLVKGG